MDAYWKYQGEKEKKLYAVIEAFAQNNGQLGVSDARYVNALKLFIQGVTPLEYYAHRGFAHVGRQFTGEGARVAAQMQSIDELRHYQTDARDQPLQQVLQRHAPFEPLVRSCLVPLSAEVVL